MRQNPEFAQNENFDFDAELRRLEAEIEEKRTEAAEGPSAGRALQLHAVRGPEPALAGGSAWCASRSAAPTPLQR